MFSLLFFIMNTVRNKCELCSFQATLEPTGIKFADFKQSGVSLRGQRVGVNILHTKLKINKQIPKPGSLVLNDLTEEPM